MMPEKEILVRCASTEDAGAIQRIYAPYVEESAISFEEVVPSEDEVRDRIGRGLSAHPWLVATCQERVLGYAYGSGHRSRHAYRWAVDVSIYVEGDWRGRGVGRMLYGGLFEILQNQGFVKAYAGITMPNEGSVRLHGSFGFRKIADFEDVGYKLGKWHTVTWWQKNLCEPTSPPPEPMPFGVLSRGAVARRLQRLSVVGGA